MLDFSVTFIITIINITVLFFILKRILFKPVTKFMAERAKQVQDSIDQSEKDKADAKELLARYEARLETAGSEADSILRAARERALQEAERIIAESRVCAEENLEKARKQLEAERHAALASFREEAATLVVAATGRLLSREIQSEDCLSYAEMLLKETAVQSQASPQAEAGKG